MRVSEFGRQRVRPLDFWIAVGFVVLLLGGMGVYFMQTGRVPQTPHWLTAVLLVLLWGRTIWDTARWGRRALPPWQVVFLLGATLFFGSDLVALGRASWVKDVGCLLFMLGLLGQWLQFGKRAALQSVNAPTDEVSE